MNGKDTGTVLIDSVDEYDIFEGAINCPPGEYELTVKAMESRNLKIAELVLE